ncbi:hypothetical protein ACRALDRAFT_208082 [Sodiomyces alcalophilus JCM 7366]|uniref:uncharacterized protein n=1 Tax=Sodiomyces alcalophilus JCM 7366 TaxID=591952 RepID=UPI0039B57DDD
MNEIIWFRHSPRTSQSTENKAAASLNYMKRVNTHHPLLFSNLRVSTNQISRILQSAGPQEVFPFYAEFVAMHACLSLPAMIGLGRYEPDSILHTQPTHA